MQVSEDVLDAFPMSIGRLRTVPSKPINSVRDVRPCTIREVHECSNGAQVGEFRSQNFLPLFLRPERVLILLQRPPYYWGLRRICLIKSKSLQHLLGVGRLVH